MTNNTVYEENPKRIAALRRFAISITIFVILGHTVLGFEQSWAQYLAGLFTAYTVELFLEIVDAKAKMRSLRWAGSGEQLINFLLPAHIVGLAVPMMLYANNQIEPIVFAAGLAIASKAIFRAPIGNGSRHFLNGTNLGIVAATLLIHGVNPINPWSLTAEVNGIWNWIVPAIIIVSGILLNAQLVGRLPLVLTWTGGFILQALLRNCFFGIPLSITLLPLTGPLFYIIALYMVTDPGTSPQKPSGQVIFGASIAFIYALLVLNRVTYSMFYAIIIVCALRGLVFYTQALVQTLSKYLSSQPLDLSPISKISQ